MGFIDTLTQRLRPDTLLGIPAIETERLHIAPLTSDDAPQVRSLTDDPAVTGAVDFLPDRFGIEDAQALISSGRHGRDVFLGARERTSGKLVGIVGTHLRPEPTIEIGYWIGGAARGRGYAGEAVGAVIALVARRFPRRLVVAECRPKNVASVGLLQKLGFVDTGEDGHRPGRRVFVWGRG